MGEEQASTQEEVIFFYFIFFFFCFPRGRSGVSFLPLCPLPPGTSFPSFSVPLRLSGEQQEQNTRQVTSARGCDPAP